MYKLYNVKAWGSVSIHCLLEEMEVPYTNIWMTPEQVREPDFESVSPLRMIPVLGLADGRSLYESAAIITFLLAAHPEKSMAPEAGSGEFGEFMSLLHLMSTELYPTINMAYPGSAYAATPEHDAFIVKTAIEKADRYWSLLQSRLEEDGPWLMGETFSALDLYAFMLTLWGKPTEAALHELFPHIAAFAGQVRQRPKLKAALEAHGVLTPGG